MDILNQWIIHAYKTNKIDVIIILVSVENQQETTSSVGDLGKEPYCYIHHDLLVLPFVL